MEKRLTNNKIGCSKAPCHRTIGPAVVEVHVHLASQGLNTQKWGENWGWHDGFSSFFFSDTRGQTT